MRNKKRVVIQMGSTIAIALCLAACGGKQDTTGTEEKQASVQEQSGEQAEQAGTAAQPADYNVDDYVKLGDYSNLKVSLTDSYEVTDADVEQYAQQMLQYSAQPTYKDTDKEVVESGDVANIDYVGKKDGVAFEGGTSSGYNLEIGSGTFIAGFEDGLIGKKVGETVDLNLTFPENYGNADLAGQAVVFTVKINKIMEKEESAKPELTDEYVKANVGYDTVEEYKNQIRSYLESNNEQQKDTAIRRAVLDKLMEVCEVTIPDGLLEQKINEFMEKFKEQNCKDKDLETYLKDTYQMTLADFQDEIHTEAEDNLRSELIIEAITKKEGTKLDEDAFKAYVAQLVSSGNYESEEAYYLENGTDAKSGEEYAKKTYLYNQTLDKIIENTDIQYGEEKTKKAEIGAEEDAGSDDGITDHAYNVSELD